MRIFVCVIITVLVNGLGWNVSVAAESKQRALVLVTYQTSHIEQLSTKDIRKLFLGFAVRQGEHKLVPIRNNTSALVKQVFLQKTIFMSEQMYDRQLQLRRFRSGSKRLQQFERQDELLQALQSTPNAITYMWSDIANNYDQLKILETLWVNSSR
jgi:Tfp pilus assembly protein PilO